MKHPLYRNPKNTKWEEQQPDDGIEKKQGNSQWPAKHKQDEPEEDAHGGVYCKYPAMEEEASRIRRVPALQLPAAGHWLLGE